MPPSRRSRARWELVSAPDSLREDFERRLRTAQSEQRLPSVSATVFRGEEILWEEALGLADVDGKREATPDTQYRIGSITKTFTAVCVLQLRDAGELSLDDPLTRFVPESAHAPTLGRMLAHSSGLQREPPGEIWETLQAPTREELVARTADAEEVLSPGSWWHYSNLAFALLGEVVARVAGRRGRRRCRSASSVRSGWRGRRRPRRARLRSATWSSRTRTPSRSSASRTSAARARSASSGRRHRISRAGARSSPPATTACSPPRRSRRWRTCGRWWITSAGRSRGGRD